MGDWCGSVNADREPTKRNNGCGTGKKTRPSWGRYKVDRFLKSQKFSLSIKSRIDHYLCLKINLWVGFFTNLSTVNQKKIDFFEWGGVFSLDKPFNGWPRCFQLAVLSLVCWIMVRMKRNETQIITLNGEDGSERAGDTYWVDGIAFSGFRFFYLLQV